MNKTGSKFSSDDFTSQKKESWFEKNRCQYTHHDKPCFMLGTSSSQGGQGGNYYCAYHIEIMHEESRATFQGKASGNRPKFNREHFDKWYKEYCPQSITPDQFTGFSPDDGNYDPNIAPLYSKEQENKIWNKVNCGRGDW